MRGEQSDGEYVQHKRKEDVMPQNQGLCDDSDSERILIQCSCKKTFKLNMEFAGKRYQCPWCAAVIDVPAVEHTGKQSESKTANRTVPSVHRAVPVEFMDSSLTSVVRHDEIFPWTTVINHPNPQPTVRRTVDGDMVLVVTRRDESLQDVFGFLGGILSAAVPVAFNRTKEVRLAHSSIEHVVRFRRPHLTVPTNWPEGLRANPPQAQIIYHVFVRTPKGKLQLHIFALRWTVDLATKEAYENAQGELDGLVSHVLPREHLIDDHKAKPPSVEIDAPCFWTNTPVKGRVMSFSQYCECYSQDRGAILGYVCPKCGVVSSSSTPASGIVWSSWFGFGRCRCRKCGAGIRDPRVVIPEEKIPEWDRHGA
jgi:hypothetical protein